MYLKVHAWKSQLGLLAYSNLVLRRLSFLSFKQFEWVQSEQPIVNHGRTSLWSPSNSAGVFLLNASNSIPERSTAQRTFCIANPKSNSIQTH
jgi:hypothetical protein